MSTKIIHIVAWNSQGHKSKALHELITILYKQKCLPALMYICEDGNRMTVKPQKDTCYPIDKKIKINSVYISMIGQWVSWHAAKKGSKGNLRCSVAMLYISKEGTSSPWQINYIKSDHYKNKGGNKRPIMIAKSQDVVIYGLHLVANTSSAEKELENIAFDLCNEANNLPFVVIGDMNFELSKREKKIPIEKYGNAKVISPQEITQRGGKRLDWGFGFGKKLHAASCNIVMGLKKSKNSPIYLSNSQGFMDSPSDHAALLYKIAVKT